jgi:VacB/RNase II family 3'-5' exoribonuclease
MEIATDLEQIASDIMVERGLVPEFPQDAIDQAAHTPAPASAPPAATDLRHLLWCSIDNDDSRDLDQLTYAEKQADNKTMLWVAIADVDALVPKDSPIDVHARTNTTSVYTPARIFPMLPEKFSTNLTSLNEGQERVAMVVKMQLNDTGDIESSSIFQALVYNFAQLTYSNIGGWLEKTNEVSDKVKKVEGLENALRTQHELAQILRKQRHEEGSLTLESAEAEIKVNNSQVNIQRQDHNFAHQLIEEFMIAANRTMAGKFKEAKIASLRRVVRIPKYWDKIVDLARELGEDLPKEPDAKALDQFLIKRKQVSPENFPDLSLSVIKLLGRGEYVVQGEKVKPIGHFALAVSDYTHSTAPNRRFPDLISQRQYKYFLGAGKEPYTLDELMRLADHCTMQEDAAVKVERQTNKCAGAALLSSHIGETFKGIVTGASDKGTWIRIFDPPVEGKIVRGSGNLRVGDVIGVKLLDVNIAKGFIDFAALGK